MDRYHIDAVKCEEGKQLLTCTPPPMYTNVASIRYTKNGESRWLYCIEVLGFHEFYSADEDLHQRFVEMDADDEEYLESKHIDEFEGLDLEPYSDGRGPEETADPRECLLKYAVMLSECYEIESVAKAVEMGIGRYSDEIALD